LTGARAIVRLGPGPDIYGADTKAGTVYFYHVLEQPATRDLTSVKVEHRIVIPVVDDSPLLSLDTAKKLPQIKNPPEGRFFYLLPVFIAAALSGAVK
jgi:hypothetical protein